MSTSLNEPPEDFLRKIRKQIGEHDGTFDGTAEGGTFAVRGIVGEYQMDKTKKITVTITKKPFWITMGMIRRWFEDTFAEKST